MNDKTEYDNTNKGVWFKPKDENAKHSLEGTINVDGVDIYVLLFRQESKTGAVYWRICTNTSFYFDGDRKRKVYTEIGSLFRSKIKETNEAAADVQGFIVVGTTEKQVSAWAKTKEQDDGTTMKYYSVMVQPKWVPDKSQSPKKEPHTPQVPDFDDDIPF